MICWPSVGSTAATRPCATDGTGWARFLLATSAAQRVSRMKGFRQWKWHLDEVYVKINGEMHYLWRAFDQEGEVLES